MAIGKQLYIGIEIQIKAYNSIPASTSIETDQTILAEQKLNIDTGSNDYHHHAEKLYHGNTR